MNDQTDERKAKLRELAEDIAGDLAAQDDAQELLSMFVSELFLAATKQAMRRERRQKQAEGIAAAKARGVRFGIRARPLPENFGEVCDQWRRKQVTLKEAARLCGMPQSTFYDAARRAAN